MAEKIGRNDLCPCGSGKKYKRCCMIKEQPKPRSLSRLKATVLSSKKAPEDAQQAAGSEDTGPDLIARTHSALSAEIAKKADKEEA